MLIITISKIHVLYFQLKVLNEVFIIEYRLILFGAILLFLIILFLLMKKSKKRLYTTITNKEKPNNPDTKSKNSFLYPEQHLGNLKQGKVYDSETFPTYNQDSCKVGEFTIIDKNK